MLNLNLMCDDMTRTIQYTPEQKDAFDRIIQAIEDSPEFQELKDSFVYEDQGIGSYEYWGFKGFDSEMVAVPKEEKNVTLDFDIPEFDYYMHSIDVEMKKYDMYGDKIVNETYTLCISYCGKNEIHIG